MRILILLIWQMVFVTAIFGQRADSIKYSNGYLFFHEYGKGEPYILLSGGPGANYQQLEDVAIRLGRQCRVILPEQRGTGRSMPQPFDTSTINLRTAKTDLKQLIDHLKLKQAHFIGHSWGAMLAMSFACDYASNVKSLILLNPGPFKLDQRLLNIYTDNKEVRVTPAEKKQRDSALERMRSADAIAEDSLRYYKWEMLPVIYDRTQVDSLIAIINKGGLNPAMGGLMFQSLYKDGFDLSDKLIHFNKPINIITGSQDPMAFISYEIKMLISKANLHWINKSGHFPMYEQPEDFYKVLHNIINAK